MKRVEKMKVLNLLSTGGIGGIEILCKDIAKYSAYENRFCFLFALGEVYDEMVQGGAETVDLSRCGTKISLRKMLNLKVLSKRYDVIVAHHGSFLLQLYFWLLSKMLTDKKYVLTSHSCFDENTYYYKNPIKTWIRKSVLKKSIKTADKIIYVSKAGRQSFLDNFDIPMKKTAVVYNGISEELIEDGRENSPRFENKLNVLYIGRLIKIKGVDLLITAVAQLKNEFPIELTIVGDGEERPRLEEKTKALSLTECVHFEGSQRNTAHYYRNANVFVYPSICREVFGISIVEAMAYGLPTIANKVGGVPEIIESGVNGYLTNEMSSMGIAVSLKAVFTSYLDGSIKHLINSAKERAGNYPVRKTVDSLQKEYSELLSL